MSRDRSVPTACSGIMGVSCYCLKSDGDTTVCTYSKSVYVGTSFDFCDHQTIKLLRQHTRHTTQTDFFDLKTHCSYALLQYGDGMHQEFLRSVRSSGTKEGAAMDMFLEQGKVSIVEVTLTLHEQLIFLRRCCHILLCTTRPSLE